MNIFEIIGIVVTIAIGVLLILITHVFIWERYRRYRIFMDLVFLLPYMIIWKIPRETDANLKNYISFMDQTRWITSKRYLFVKWVFRKRIKNLKE